MNSIAQQPVTAQWWDSEPVAVRAVLNLAWMRNDATPEIHDEILATFAPDHADAIADISTDLELAEQYDCGQLDWQVGPIVAERLVETHRGDALRAAQLVASLLPRQRTLRAVAATS